MHQLEKPPANEITEPLALTVCKLELHRKAIVLQSCSRHTWLAVVNKGQNKRKKYTCTSKRQKQTKEQVPWCGFKEALISDNEESDDEE